jgi:L-ascorbate metabolism protein UlaG (beta-lactamase superfamily)
MKITKLEHACVVLEKDGEQLVIDPGVLTNFPDSIKNVVGIFITHVHADHLDKNNVQKLLAANPKACLMGSDEVLAELKDLGAKECPVVAGVGVKAGNFNIEVFGQDHAVIYKKVPCQNRGLLVDDYFYYPGDSFTLPNMPVEVLAAPAIAPWAKTSEAMDFIKAVKPKKVFPTHNAMFSSFGEQVFYSWLKPAAEEVGAEWVELQPGNSI